MRAAMTLCLALSCAPACATDDFALAPGRDAQQTEEFELTYKCGYSIGKPWSDITTTIRPDVPFRDSHRKADGSATVVYGLLRQARGKYVLDVTAVEEDAQGHAQGSFWTEGEYKIDEPHVIGICAGICVDHLVLLGRHK